jgi:hypothetical protein
VDLQGHFQRDGASGEHAKTLSSLVVGFQNSSPLDGLAYSSIIIGNSSSFQLPASQTGSVFGFSVPEAQLQHPIQYGMPLQVDSAAYTIGLDRAGFMKSSWKQLHNPFLNRLGFGDVLPQHSNTPGQGPGSGLGSPFAHPPAQYSQGLYEGGPLRSAAPPSLLWALQPLLPMRGARTTHQIIPDEA